MAHASATALRIVLFLAGAFIVFTGINIAFGGMLTLGWQGQTIFFSITDEHAYLVQDSHIRFLGGLWLGIGLLFLLSSTNLEKYQGPLNFAFALIFLGGLTRFSQMNLAITSGKEIIGSLIAELIGMPILCFWLSRAVRQTKQTGESSPSA